MDAFYASVEQRDDPSLRGKPVAVGGGSRRGVVASASYEARRFGVRSAMPGAVASRLCPDLVFVKSRFDVYRQVSRQIRDVFHEYTDLVEPLSLDEAYLDVTECKQPMESAVAIAEAIRRDIFEQTGLTASAGISFNKFLAKLASDINKPDGLKLISQEEAQAFLESLAVEKFHGIGKVTASKMHRMGIRTGADLKKMDRIELLKRFGKVGDFYYKIVRAQDTRAVNPHRERKSIGAERTFSNDLSILRDMQEKIRSIANIVFRSMEKREQYGRTVTLKMKTTDFQIITRSKTFSWEVRTYSELEKTALELLEENWQHAGPVRLLGLTVSNLERIGSYEGMQLELGLEEEE